MILRCILKYVRNSWVIITKRNLFNWRYSTKEKFVFKKNKFKSERNL